MHDWLLPPVQEDMHAKEQILTDLTFKSGKMDKDYL